MLTGFLIFGEIFEIFDDFSKFSNACSTKFYKILAIRLLKESGWKLSEDAEYTFKFKNKFFFAELWISVTGPRFWVITTRYLVVSTERVNRSRFEIFLFQKWVSNQKQLKK